MVCRNLGENYERCVADSVNLTATEKNSSDCLFFFISQERENPTLTEWDRFAQREYVRLSMEEDEVSNGSADVWDEPLESPF